MVVAVAANRVGAWLWRKGGCMVVAIDSQGESNLVGGRLRVGLFTRETLHKLRTAFD